MNSQPLPESTSPTPPSSLFASSKQPTYHTAGTIYKPSSSQPLQPPARRGRSLRWPTGSSLNAADLAFLPKTALSELKTSVGNSYSALQQYTPLQQNYDRAVSPFNNQDHIYAKMPIEKPHLQLSNISNFQSIGMSDPRISERLMRSEKEVFFGNPSSDGEDGDNEDDGDNDEDDDVNNNALKNLPVQSLAHLASYSNPTQKAARRAFQRGSRARQYVLSSSTGSASSTSPSGLASLRTQDVSNDEGQGVFENKHLLMPETYTLKPPQRDVSAKLDDVLSTGNSAPLIFPYMSPRANSESLEVSQSARMHISGKNAPMPLTAGPPGQRQFRPFNFEKALKTLSLQSSPLGYNEEEEEDDAFLNTNHWLKKRGTKEFYEVSGPQDMMPTRSSTLSTAFKYKSRKDQKMPQGVQLPSGIVDSEEESCNTSVPIPSPGLVGHQTVLGQSWTKHTPTYGYHSSSANHTARLFGPGRMTDEEYKEHLRKLDERWYRSERVETTNVVHSRPRETTNVIQPHRREPYKYGAIGDNRPRASVSGSNATGMMEEAGTMIPDSDCIRSLLDIVNIACNLNNNGNNDAHICAEGLVSASVQ
ncbi:hypothetical protein E4U21_007742 [Claviceps maximensis]|nr:hypothetical protein E4U21_007742 [Claviceps maximensis]